MKVTLLDYAFLEGRLLSPSVTVSVPDNLAAVLLANGKARTYEVFAVPTAPDDGQENKVQPDLDNVSDVQPDLDIPPKGQKLGRGVK